MLLEHCPVCHFNAMHCTNQNGMKGLVSVTSGELRGLPGRAGEEEEGID